MQTTINIYDGRLRETTPGMPTTTQQITKNSYATKNVRSITCSNREELKQFSSSQQQLVPYMCNSFVYTFS